MPRSRSPISSGPRQEGHWSRSTIGRRDRSHDRERSHSGSTRIQNTPRSPRDEKDYRVRTQSRTTSRDSQKSRSVSQSSLASKDSERKRRQSRHSSSSSSSSESSDSSVERRKRKKSKRRRKRRNSSSSSSSSSSEDTRGHSKGKVKKKTRDDESSSSESSSDSSQERRRAKKKLKKERKKKKKAEKKRKKKEKKQRKKEKKRLSEMSQSGVVQGPTLIPTASVNEAKPKDDGEKARSMRPMTKEEWEKQQSVVRRVFDPDTGRNRLVKGDGEIIEEIVSKERHKQINQQATQGDGLSFMRGLGLNK
ncbi:ADP-ribosylation factor-like protein 6-interacting protein 4 [Branchiostoma belcheri]|nr:ADP-ribosylation factor-like protein 6-interacting protein 4 [Branchiostoma belcheri]